jgi:hypothetical protein
MIDPSDSDGDDLSDSELYRVVERTVAFETIPGAAEKDIKSRTIIFHGGNLLLLFGSLFIIIFFSIVTPLIILLPINNNNTTHTKDYWIKDEQIG